MKQYPVVMRLALVLFLILAVINVAVSSASGIKPRFNQVYPQGDVIPQSSSKKSRQVVCTSGLSPNECASGSSTPSGPNCNPLYGMIDACSGATSGTAFLSCFCQDPNLLPLTECSLGGQVVAGAPDSTAYISAACDAFSHGGNGIKIGGKCIESQDWNSPSCQDSYVYVDDSSAGVKIAGKQAQSWCTVLVIAFAFFSAIDFI